MLEEYARLETDTPGKQYFNSLRHIKLWNWIIWNLDSRLPIPQFSIQS